MSERPDKVDLIKSQIQNIFPYDEYEITVSYTHLDVYKRQKEGHKTVVTILDWDYSTSFKESFFSLQNMRRLN